MCSHFISFIFCIGNKHIISVNVFCGVNVLYSDLLKIHVLYDGLLIIQVLYGDLLIIQVLYGDLLIIPVLYGDLLIIHVLYGDLLIIQALCCDLSVNPRFASSTFGMLGVKSALFILLWHPFSLQVYKSRILFSNTNYYLTLPLLLLLLPLINFISPLGIYCNRVLLFSFMFSITQRP